MELDGLLRRLAITDEKLAEPMLMVIDKLYEEPASRCCQGQLSSHQYSVL